MWLEEVTVVQMKELNLRLHLSLIPVCVTLNSLYRNYIYISPLNLKNMFYPRLC